MRFINLTIAAAAYIKSGFPKRCWLHLKALLDRQRWYIPADMNVTYHIDGLIQDYSNSSAMVMKLQ